MLHQALLLANIVMSPLGVPEAGDDATLTAGSDSTVVMAPAVCMREVTPTDNGAPLCAVLALRIAEDDAPELDGRLDDAIWMSAQPATGFRQQEPTPGDLSSQRTEARVVYTGDAVYVGIRLYDTSPDSIRAQFIRRDDHAAVSDWAHVMLDTYYDRRTAFEFATTPRGTRVDILHLDDTSVDAAWDAVWDVATGVDSEGWVAEFRIPLSQLRFSGGEDLRWGINFGRKVARLSEVSYWAPLPPNAGKVVSLYGDLAGLEGLSSPGGLELLPYSVGRLTRKPGDAANPFYNRNETWQSVGLDLKYGITSNLTLTATVNPDFGQVEADPSKVNLTAFETFYTEKRPFFTEGTEIFNLRLPPEGYAFYSRRIGRAPQLSASPPSGGFADTPETARILGAVKLSGKTAGGWSVGLMNAFTGQVNTDVSGPDGIESRALEPRTSYTAGRLSRDFREGRSGLGVLATAANRTLNDESFERLRSASYTGAVDWWHRFGSGSNFEFNGWFLGTHARGSADAMARTQRSASHLFTRPDADHLTYDPTITSMNGWAGEAGIAKRGGGNWTWRLGGGARSPGVELNDLGFLLYADTWYGSATARYREFTAGSVFRNWHVESQYLQAYTFGSEMLRNSLHLRLNGTFLNFWRGTLNTDRWFSHQWPWELRGGPALRRSPYTNVRATLRSDSRRSWAVNLRGTARRDDVGGSRIFVVDPLVDFRPSSRATISLGPSLRWNRDADQYLTRVTSEGGSEYVVGHLDQTTVALTMRVSYGFTPTLNLDVYAQPFVSTGAFDGFRTVDQANAEDFEERVPLIPSGSLSLDAETNRYVTPDFTFRNPDFNVREFRMNAVLRWEYKPGSTFFLVWTQARAENAVLGDFDLGRDLDQLFLAPATNVFMLKVNYWIGM